MMHRSQQDPLYHDDENGSKFILHPADRKTALALESGVLQQEGSASYVSSEAAAKSKQELAEKRTKNLGPIREYREVDEYGLPLDGYDYAKHLSTVGGGAFISADGSRVENIFPVVEKAPVEEDVLQKLPETVFASNQEQPRLLEAITLRPEGMDPEMKRQLGLVSDEEEEEDVESEATGEWGDLQDDFMAQLVSEGAMENVGDEEDDNEMNGGVNDGEFDFDAHMARLMKEAEEEDRLAEGEEDDEDDEEDEFDRLARRHAGESSRPDRPVRDVDEHFDTVLAAEYENDDDDDEDYYQQEGEDLEQYDAEQLLNNLKDEDYDQDDDELEEFEGEEEEMEKHFNHADVEEEEELYRSTVATSHPRKTMDSESHTTMTRRSKRPQAKLISQDDPVFLQAINEFLEQKASDQSLGDVAAPPPAAETLRLVKSNLPPQEVVSVNEGENVEAQEQEEEDDEEDVEPPTYDQMIKLWGTYSVTAKPQFDCETIISTRSTTDNIPAQIEITGMKSKKAKKQIQPSQPPPIVEEEQSLEADDDDQGTVDSVTREIAKMALQGLAERSKHETPEERKARKNKLKEMKRERRVQKKSTKEAFKKERAQVLHALTAENAPRPGVSEFKI